MLESYIYQLIDFVVYFLENFGVLSLIGGFFLYKFYLSAAAKSSDFAYERRQVPSKLAEYESAMKKAREQQQEKMAALSAAASERKRLMEDMQRNAKIKAHDSMTSGSSAKQEKPIPKSDTGKPKLNRGPSTAVPRAYSDYMPLGGGGGAGGYRPSSRRRRGG
eukprot:Rmarinus@m.6249